MRLVWITDPHLDFLPPIGSVKFAEWVRKTSHAHAAVITGDIGEYPSLTNVLTLFAMAFKKPVYFVLGNHDHYRGSFEKVSQAAHIIHESELPLFWLDKAGVVELTPDTALVGNGGWYDARSGNPEGSNVLMSDFTIIDDFKRLGSPEARIQKCREVSARLTEEARPVLIEAAQKYKNVYFATHVPPFREACWHRGKISNSDWLPWFTNLTLGAMLADVASDHPQTQFTVLCGHTHSPGLYQHLDNLLVCTGKAEYHNPQVSRVFTLRQEDQAPLSDDLPPI